VVVMREKNPIRMLKYYYNKKVTVTELVVFSNFLKEFNFVLRLKVVVMREKNPIRMLKYCS